METCKNMSEFVKVVRSVEALTDEFIDISFSTSEVTILKTDTHIGIDLETGLPESLICEKSEKLFSENDGRGFGIWSNVGIDLEKSIDLITIQRLFYDLDGSDYVFKVDIDKIIASDGSGEWFSIDFIYTEK